MSLEGLAAGTLGPAEATAAVARAQRLQELVTSASSATTPAGESSFAAALQAASAEGEAPPEAPEPAEAPAASAALDPEGAGGSGLASAATSAYGSPYLAAESSAASTLDAATGGVQASPQEATLGAGTYPYEAGDTGASTVGYPGSSAGYAPQTSYGATYGAPADGASSLPLTSAAAYPATIDGGAAYTGAGYASASGGAVGSSPYASLIAAEASRNGVEPALLQGLIEQESGFDPTAESSAGAQGLTQLMPSTAASLGVSDPLDPQQAIAGGAKLLGQLLQQFGGNVSDALAAYNAGAGAVQEYGGVPPYPETEAYVSKVLANAQTYRGTSV